jgi:hypothetical protein
MSGLRFVNQHVGSGRARDKISALRIAIDDDRAATNVANFSWRTHIEVQNLRVTLASSCVPPSASSLPTISAAALLV